MGMTHPSFKHGRFSRYLPPRLTERFEASLQDPDLLTFRQDVALLDARLEDLLRRADTGEAGRAWEGLKRARSEFIRARNAKDPEGTTAAIGQMLSLIEGGYQDHLTWEDIRATLMDRAKLVRAEHRRLVDLNQMVQVDRLVTFMQVLASILMEEIPEKGVARRVVGRIQTLLSLEPGQQATTY